MKLVTLIIFICLMEGVQAQSNFINKIIHDITTEMDADDIDVHTTKSITLDLNSFRSQIDTIEAYRASLPNSVKNQIKNCIEHVECTAYRIEIQSEYYGGFSLDYYFVLNTNEHQDYTRIHLNLYTE